MNPVNPVNPVQNNYKVTPSLRMNASDEISVEALEKFDSAGCRVVDISVDDASQLSTFNSQLSTVAAYAAAHGWTMLLHLGALRETSSRLRAAAGPAGGFAGMRAPVDPAAVAAFLNGLESTHNVFSRKEDSTRATRLNNPVQNSLPRTILLSLNPEAHASLAVLAGSFNGAGLPGKVQLGPAWWWCDHEEGIRDVLEKNAAYGVLSTFVGMTTDSRSLLSFVRHDYFRRILCKWVAEKVASGSFPDDESLLRPMLENICYKNAKGMFS
jgi:glucuronate isomerase